LSMETTDAMGNGLLKESIFGMRREYRHANLRNHPSWKNIADGFAG